MSLSTPKQRPLFALWSAALETWFHQLLYIRHVYPRETFAPTRFLGVSCRACRHRGVVRYISDSLQVIVPSLLLGSATQVSLVIMKDSFTAGETFTLTLTNDAPNGFTEEQDSLQHVERVLRDLILSVLSLEGLPKQRLSEDASFKLSLRTAQCVDNAKTEISKALHEGTWHRPNATSTSSDESSNGMNKVQPIYHASLPIGGTIMQMNLITHNKQEH